MNLDTKSLRLNILLQAKKAGDNALRIEKLLDALRTKYPPKSSFEPSEFEMLMQEYIQNLEIELQEEKEFLSYVVRQYCVTNKDPHTETGEVCQATSRWS